MRNQQIWLEGVTRSGKTGFLVEEFRKWIIAHPFYPSINNPSALVLTAVDENKRNLIDRLTGVTGGKYPIVCKTAVGFITDEVILFWPLIFEKLNIKARFPRKLRPENEQELAERLLGEEIESAFRLTGNNGSRFVRLGLDLLQLAGAGGIPAEEIPARLVGGLSEIEKKRVLAIGESETPEILGQLLLKWRDYCLDRGLISYGIAYELYWRYLLPDVRYQHQLSLRYDSVFADDVDEYPAIGGDLLAFFLEKKNHAVLTYNLAGRIRVGMTADPDRLLKLSLHCRKITLEGGESIAAREIDTILGLIGEGYGGELSPAFVSLQTPSRASLLRETARTIIDLIRSGTAKPSEIAIIVPGLDEITRYTLGEILDSAGIPLRPLNEQRPLIANPPVRALLTLLCTVYPVSSRFVTVDNAAEMLVVLGGIDPVRAGLIADYCYSVEGDRCSFLPLETFSRWDRFGHRAADSYGKLRDRIGEMRERVEREKMGPVEVLDGAIEQFLNGGKDLPYERLSALRELMETARYYWTIERCLSSSEPGSREPLDTLVNFIQLLRRGTIAANPYPDFSFFTPESVTLGNIFQYRSLRSCHRYHFWLDCSNSLWEQAGAANFFASGVFKRDAVGILTPEMEAEADRSRLERILRDLTARVTERVFLCHCDLGVNGSEQIGVLLALVQNAKQWQREEIAVI